MRVAFFDTHNFERPAFEMANAGKHEILFFPVPLSLLTVELAKGCQAICCFVNDKIDRAVIEKLKDYDIGLIAIRAAGYNNVDIMAAKKLGITVMRVPEYSPHAVAEYTVALLLTLNRKTHKAYNRVHEMNFSLDGLVGFDLAGKTVGVIGTGKIGKIFAQIMKGFGCKVLLYDIFPDPTWAGNLGAEYSTTDKIFSQSDVISLHVPLTPETQHLISEEAFKKMKSSAILLNTGRGALVQTSALIKALKQKKIAGAALDVYEEEQGVFFSDLSGAGIEDDVLARLTTFPNVLITSHQAFLTHEALANIADTTIQNISAFENAQKTATQVEILL
jgi:D-lactate dehydrogenase